MQAGKHPPRKVTLVPYDPKWVLAYEQFAAEIVDGCQPFVIAIHHIGSTSVPGLAAKPIIDMMPGLSSYEAGLECVEPMRRLGYEYHGEYGIPRRHFFTSASPARHVHMYPIGEGQWPWHLALRDHLRSRPADRERYYRLKEELAARHPWDVDAYATAKGEFIRSIVGRYVDLDQPSR